MDLAFSLVAVFSSKLPAWMGAVSMVLPYRESVLWAMSNVVRTCRLRYLLPSFSVRLLLPICRQRYFLVCSRLRYLLNKFRLRYLITFRAAFFRCRYHQRTEASSIQSVESLRYWYCQMRYSGYNSDC